MAIQPGDAIQVHASMLAIYFGFLTAYALQVSHASLAWKQHILREALRANRPEIPIFYTLRSSSPSFDRSERLTLLISLKDSLDQFREDPDSAKAKEILGVMSRLTSSYPFVPHGWNLNDTSIDFQNGKLYFPSVSAVKLWADELLEVATQLEGVLRANQQELGKMAELVDSGEEIGWMAIPNKFPVTEMSCRDAIEAFFSGLLLTRQRTAALVAEVEEYELSRTSPSREWLLLKVGFPVGIVAFFFGVIAPLLGPTAFPPMIYNVVPVVCYALIGGVTMLSLWGDSDPGQPIQRS